MTVLKFIAWAVAILVLMSVAMCFVALWATPQDQDELENCDVEGQ